MNSETVKTFSITVSVNISMMTSGNFRTTGLLVLGYCRAFWDDSDMFYRTPEEAKESAYNFFGI